MKKLAFLITTLTLLKGNVNAVAEPEDNEMNNINDVAGDPGDERAALIDLYVNNPLLFMNALQNMDPILASEIQEVKNHVVNQKYEEMFGPFVPNDNYLLLD